MDYRTENSLLLSNIIIQLLFAYLISVSRRNFTTKTTLTNRNKAYGSTLNGRVWSKSASASNNDW